jgi:endonuclease/exonuclease/phosphatase (EEP) superfamily protein YafD
MEINNKNSMLNLVSVNLLAEKPYRKYGEVVLVDFAIRSDKFYSQIIKLMPDVILLQEVDLLWQEYLNLKIVKLGYSIQFGDCWSSGLAILWKDSSMKKSNTQPISFDEAGVLKLELIQNESNKVISFINLHAKWARAKEFDNIYSSVISANGPLIIAGDLNTDNPKENNNFQYFFSQLFNAEKGYAEITESVPFTARNVKYNNPEKLDYILGLNVFGNETCIYPDELSLLLPHRLGGEYNYDNENNHFSDHALVFSTISF